ncbi:MAG: ABC transporter ATP-binding protein [Thermaerobacter sp.]|nr:ABC transporter ATP-binding protein [Thermaerobacter sp.]
MVSLQQVRKTYPAPVRGQDPLLAVDTIDLTLADGQFCSLVGPSGCGKTTILNLVGGFEQPSAGRIAASGRSVIGPGPDRAVVFQEAALLPWMTVEANLAFALTLRGGRPAANTERIAQMMEVMGLTGFERHYPYHLSGGMQQRVAIGRALLTNPEVLLMDEPFGALDAQTRSDLQRFLLELWSRLNPTVLFVTHDVEEAILLADRVVVMSPRPGRIVDDIAVNLPRPRTWDAVLNREFGELRRQVLDALRPSDSRARRLS